MMCSRQVGVNTSPSGYPPPSSSYSRTHSHSSYPRTLTRSLTLALTLAHSPLMSRHIYRTGTIRLYHQCHILSSSILSSHLFLSCLPAIVAVGDTLQSSLPSWTPVNDQGLAIHLPPSPPTPPPPPAKGGGAVDGIYSGGRGGVFSDNGLAKSFDYLNYHSLWARTISYTHHRAGMRLFSGPSSTLHHLSQLLYIQEPILPLPLPLPLKHIHPIHQTPVYPTITIAEFMNLSDASPFCKDYHYTTTYTLIPENYTTITTSSSTSSTTTTTSSSTSSSSSSTSSGSSSGSGNGDRTISNNDNNANVSISSRTRVLVSLQRHQGAPSMYQSFILSGIKSGQCTILTIPFIPSLPPPCCSH